MCREKHREVCMDNKFYVKSALIGAIGTTISSYRYNDLGNVSINVLIWVTILVFMEHFQFILLFWLTFENKLRVKNWLLIGFLGSLLYAISFWVIRGFIFAESSPVYFFDKLFAGTIGAIPLWFILRKTHSRAYLWIVGNSLGYAFIGIYPLVWGLIMSISIVNNVAGYSFLTAQLVPNSLWVIAYSLFGLILGVCLDKITKENSSNDKVV